MKIKKLLSKLNYLEIVIVCILCIEVFYLCLKKDTLLTRLLKINLSTHVENFKFNHILIILAVVALTLGYLCITHLLQINYAIAFLFLCVNIWIYLEYVIQKNKNLTDKQMSLQNVIKQCNTGDIILWNTPTFMPDVFYIIPTLFVGIHHIGIIVKHNNNQIYIIECDQKYDYCQYSKKMKNGTIVCDFKDRMLEYPDELYYIQSNMHTRVTNSHMYNFIEKHKDVIYGEGFMNCISFIHEFLNEYNLLNEKYSVRPIYIDYKRVLEPSFYNFDYKQEIYKITKE